MKAYFAEGIGTFLLIFIGTLTMTQAEGNVLLIAAAFGATLFVVVALLGPFSGAHVNPAVSLGAWLRGDLSSHDIVPYWIAQIAGAILGSTVVFFIVGTGHSLGETTFALLQPWSAFLLETVLTLVYVAVILAASRRRPMQKAFLLGGALLVLHIAALPLTGAGINPARSIAPVVVGANPEASRVLWVYVAGPFLGGAVAGILGRVLRSRS